MYVHLEGGGATWVKADDWISFKVSGTGGSVLCVRVLKVDYYSTFAKMLQAHGPESALPGVACIVLDGVAVYHSLSDRSGRPYAELEREHGVVAFTVRVLREQDT